MDTETEVARLYRAFEFCLFFVSMIWGFIMLAIGAGVRCVE